MAADGSLKFDTGIIVEGFHKGIRTLKQAVESFQKKIDKTGNQIDNTFNKSDKVAALEKEIDQTTDKIEKLMQEMKKLEDTPVPTEEYRQLSDLVEKTQMRLDRLLERQEKMSAMGTKENSRSWKNLQYDIDATSQKLNIYKGELQDTVDRERAFISGTQTDAYQTKAAKLSELNDKLYTQKQRLNELIASEAASNQEMQKTVGIIASVINGFHMMGSFLKRIPGFIAKGLSGIPGMVKNISFAFKKLLPETNKASKSILKLSNMFKLMLIRMAIRAAIQGVKDGLQNLAQYSERANQTISSLVSGLTYLKNSFGAAFEPILSFVAPVLNTLIDLLATAVTYINQFFAALGGSSTFIKAKKVQEDYAKSLKKTGGAANDAKKSLAGFDELNVLNDQNSSGGSGSSTDPSEMFETVSVSDSVNGFAEQIRAAFDAGDWKSLGTLIGDKFNNLVDDIDWSGFGHKIGYSVNGAVQTAYYALKEADFVNLGNHVAESVNSGFSEIDFTFVGRLLMRKFTAGIDLFFGFIGGLDWSLVGKSVGDGLRGAFEESYDWITGIDWSQMAHDLYSNIKEFLIGIDFASLAESFFKSLGAALGAGVRFIVSFLSDIADDINKYFYKYLTNEDGSKKTGTDWFLGVLEGIKDAVVGIIEWIHDHVALPLINGFKDAFGIHSPSTVMAELGGYLIEGLKEGVVNFIPNLIKEFIGLKDKIAEIWGEEGISGIIKGCVNGIVSAAESMVNFIIRAINGLITNLNKISIDIPDTPFGDGFTLGFNIPSLNEIRLPRLASGTVVPPRAGEFAAILGDNNREAEVVSPLSTIEKALDNVLSKHNLLDGGEIHITLNMDSKVLYDTIVKRNQMTKKQTGKNPLLV